MRDPYIYVPSELENDEDAQKIVQQIIMNRPEAVIAGLAYELVQKDLAIQTLEQTQADTLYQLMIKGVL